MPRPHNRPSINPFGFLSLNSDRNIRQNPIPALHDECANRPARIRSIERLLEICQSKSVQDTIHDGVSPLIAAISVPSAAYTEDDRRIARKLLKTWPDLARLPDDDGNLPLHCASTLGDVDMVEIITEVFPEALLIRNKDGRVPTRIAASGTWVAKEVLRYLVKQSPESCSIKDNYNVSALDLVDDPRIDYEIRDFLRRVSNGHYFAISPFQNLCETLTMDPHFIKTYFVCNGQDITVLEDAWAANPMHFLKAKSIEELRAKKLFFFSFRRFQLLLKIDFRISSTASSKSACKTIEAETKAFDDLVGINEGNFLKWIIIAAVNASCPVPKAVLTFLAHTFPTALTQRDDIYTGLYPVHLLASIAEDSSQALGVVAMENDWRFQSPQQLAEAEKEKEEAEKEDLNLLSAIYVAARSHPLKLVFREDYDESRKAAAASEDLKESSDKKAKEVCGMPPSFNPTSSSPFSMDTSSTSKTESDMSISM